MRCVLAESFNAAANYWPGDKMISLFIIGVQQKTFIGSFFDTRCCEHQQQPSPCFFYRHAVIPNRWRIGPRTMSTTRHLQHALWHVCETSLVSLGSQPWPQLYHSFIVFVFMQFGNRKATLYHLLTAEPFSTAIFLLEKVS